MPSDHKPSTTPVELVNEIRMSRSSEPGASVMIVEGATDRKFFAAFVVPSCLIFSAGNKEKAVKTLVLLEKQVFSGVLAIIDRDFPNPETQDDVYQSDNLLFTDTSDLETLLFQSPALEKLLRNTLSDQQLKSLNQIVTRLREVSLKLAEIIGYIRWVDNRHRDYNFSLRKISYQDVIDGHSLTINQHNLVMLVTNGITSVDDVLQEIQLLKTYKLPPERVCRGHDLIAIAAIVLPIICSREFNLPMSGKAEVQTKANELSRTLRVAYETDFFRSTSLYVSIQVWETKNEPFKVLKA